MNNDRIEPKEGNSSILGCLIPTFWMLVGNGILALCAVAIAAGEALLFTVADLFYWLTVGSLAGARYVDIRYFSGRTSEGAPATMADWRRYTAVLVAVAVAVWIVVQLIPGLGV